MLSAKEGSREIVDILLRHQAQPNAVDEVCMVNCAFILVMDGLTLSHAQESGYTALMFAAEAGHLDIVSSLLKANAQVFLKNKVKKNNRQLV